MERPNDLRWLAGVTALTLALAAPAAGAGVIAHWTFEEGTPGQTATGTGSVLDSSGQGHHGTPIGGPVYQTATGGDVGLDFDGANDRVFVPDHPDFVTNSITVEAIIELDSLPPTNGLDQIVFRGDSRSGFDPFYLGILSGKLRFYVQSSATSADAVHSPDPLPVNQLIHVAGTLDDATGAMRLFIDGVEVDSKNTTVRPTVALQASQNPGVGIGNLQDGLNQYLDGTISEARISDMALAPHEFLGASASLPSPATAALALLGLAAAAARRRRRAPARR